MPETGSFSCSNEIFNGAHRLIRNAIRSNAHAVFTDCPHREKLGWLDQVQFNGPGLFYGYDLREFARKVMQDMADAQHPDGMVPTTAPEFTTFTGQWECFSISPEWGSAFIVWPLIYNRFYDDDSLVREYYDQMHAYLDWLGTQAVDGVLDFGLGDWYDYAGGASGFAQNTPIDVVASAQYYLDILAMKEASLLLHNLHEIGTGDVGQERKKLFQPHGRKDGAQHGYSHPDEHGGGTRLQPIAADGRPFAP